MGVRQRLGGDHPRPAALLRLDRDGKLAWRGRWPFTQAACKPLETALRTAPAAPGPQVVYQAK